MKKVVCISVELGHSEYAVFTDIEDLEVDDLVVIQNNGNRSNLGFSVAVVVKVRGIEKSIIQQAQTWIVQKVDIKEFNEKQKKEELKQEIINQMESISEEDNHLERFKLMSETNPAIKKLLEEYAKLDSDTKLLADT